MRKLFLGISAIFVLASVPACVSAYSQPLSSANHRAVFVQDHDVRYYRDTDPNRGNRPPVPPPSNPGYAPNQNSNGILKPPPSQQSGQAPQCRYNSDCPNSQRCYGATIRKLGQCRRY